MQNNTTAYFSSSAGFGNKVCELIAVLFVKQKYGCKVILGLGSSYHDNKSDPDFKLIFNKCNDVVDIIDIREYRNIVKKINITEIKIKNITDFPEKVTDAHVSFGKSHYFLMHKMYHNLNSDFKSYIDINLKLINKHVLNITNEKKYVAVHVRYGDKLCYAYKDETEAQSVAQDKSVSEKSSKPYTYYAVYTPSFYIDFIKKYLDTGTVVIVVSDSYDLVNKFIIEPFRNHDNIKKLHHTDAHYLDSFYILTKASALLVSQSTFSFTAAYINNGEVYSFDRNRFKGTPRESNPIDTENWKMIFDTKYILNLNQELVKEMITYYGKCDNYKKIIAIR